MDRFSLIIKITDQCNLHCPYCYYYAGDAASLRTRKHRDVGLKLERLVTAITQSEKIMEAEQLLLVLHGGEPLLLPKPVVERFLADLRERLGSRPDITLQTNGVLVDEEWVRIFSRYKVGVGVSIDGPAWKHDEFRIHANGSGSHAEAVRGYRLLKEASDRGELDAPGLLAVYDPAVSAREYFDLFVGELGAELYDLLFPDDLERFPNVPEVVQAFNRTVAETWRLWAEKDDPQLAIRFISGALSSWYNQRPHLDNPEATSALVADMAGDVFFEDDLRPALSLETLKVGSWMVEGFDALIGRAFKQMSGLRDYHADCRSCEFLGACRGGQFAFRVDPVTRIFGKSVLCDVYKTGFSNARNLIEKLQRAA